MKDYETDYALWNKNFLKICLSSFFIFINFYLLAATMPIYVKNDLQGSVTDISLIISMYIFGTVLIRPFSGKWADEYGKKKTAVIFLILFSLCNIAYFGTKAIFPLLIIRFINGFGFAVGTTSTAALAMDWISPKRKGEGIGYFGLFMSLAMVVGPALGLYLTNNFDYNVLLTVAAVFALASLIFTILSEENPNTKKIDNTIKYTGIEKYVELKSVKGSFAGFLIAFAYSSLLSYIALYCIELNEAKTSVYFFIVFALFIIIPRPLIGKILDKNGPKLLIYFGSILFVVGLVILSFANSAFTILIGSAIIGFGYGALFPAYQTLSITEAPTNRAGTASATFFLLYDIGVGLGSFCMGIFAGFYSYSSMYLFATIFVIISLVFFVLVINNQNNFKKSVK